MGRYNNDYGYGGFAPYVPVRTRRRNAERAVAKLRKKGRVITPVVIDGRTVARTFWGKAWCENLEAYSDYANRLPRGRTYVRNGSVVDLAITAKNVTALVSGSSLYTVKIGIDATDRARWRAIVRECAGKIDSVIELLQGKLSQGVMEVITRKTLGLFPSPKEIKLRCSCPDFATMCKHVAATLYGVGARLDVEPELLFVLRGVDMAELVSEASRTGAFKTQIPTPSTQAFDGTDLAALFGIELDGSDTLADPPREARASKIRTRRKPKAVALPRVRTRELVTRGIPHATIQRWIRAGVLVPTGERGLYETTAETEARIADHLATGVAPPRVESTAVSARTRKRSAVRSR